MNDAIKKIKGSSNIFKNKDLEQGWNSARQEAQKNCDEFDEKIQLRTSTELTEEDRKKLNHPSFWASLLKVRNYAAENGNTDRTRILEDILIEKIKTSKDDEQESLYNDAIEAARTLTLNELQLLIFIEYYSSILYSLITKTGYIEHIELFSSIFTEKTSFSIDCIKRCEQKRLLYTIFLKEYNLAILEENDTHHTKYQEHINISKEIIARNSNENIKLTSYFLSKTGQIIAKTAIKNMGISYIAESTLLTTYSDLIAKNIIGQEAVTALAIYQSKEKKQAL